MKSQQLLRLQPIKQNLASEVLFGEINSNTMTKITNRLSGKTSITEEEDQKITQAYRELALKILEITSKS